MPKKKKLKIDIEFPYDTVEYSAITIRGTRICQVLAPTGNSGSLIGVVFNFVQHGSNVGLQECSYSLLIPLILLLEYPSDPKLVLEVTC